MTSASAGDRSLSASARSTGRRGHRAFAPFGRPRPSRRTGTPTKRLPGPERQASEHVGDVLQRPSGHDGRAKQAAPRKAPGQAQFGGQRERHRLRGERGRVGFPSGRNQRTTAARGSDAVDRPANQMSFSASSAQGRRPGPERGCATSPPWRGHRCARRGNARASARPLGPERLQTLNAASASAACLAASEPATAMTRREASSAVISAAPRP